MLKYVHENRYSLGLGVSFSKWKHGEFSRIQENLTLSKFCCGSALEAQRAGTHALLKIKLNKRPAFTRATCYGCARWGMKERGGGVSDTREQVPTSAAVPQQAAAAGEPHPERRRIMTVPHRVYSKQLHSLMTMQLVHVHSRNVLRKHHHNGHFEKFAGIAVFDSEATSLNCC